MKIKLTQTQATLIECLVYILVAGVVAAFSYYSFN